MERFKFASVGEYIFSRLNSIPGYIFIVFLLSFNFLTVAVLPNEEHYLGLAKQFMDPDWLPNSFIFNEWPGERLIFQYFAGWMLTFLSFPQTAFLGKLIIILSISFPLSILFKNFGLSNLELLIPIQLFFLGNQAFFAGEMILETFEPKSLAYIFIFIGLVFFLRGKILYAFLSVAIATYCHFLVGGWVLIFLNIYLIFYQFDFKKWILLNVFYFVLVAPMIYFLYTGVGDIPSTQNGLAYNYLITHFRCPWHTVIDVSQFKGIVYMIVSLLLSILYIVKNTTGWVKEITRLNIIIMSVVLFFVAVSFFDTHFFFIRFLPFRPASISFFLFLITITVAIKNTFLNYNGLLQNVHIIALALLIPAMGQIGINQIIRHKQRNRYNLVETYKYIKEHTKKSDVFLFLGYSDPLSVNSSIEPSFSRLTDRDLMVLFKFAKYDTNIYEWYDRLQFYDSVDKHPALVKKLIEKYKLDYVISKRELDPEDGFELKMVKRQNHLYKINF